MEEQKILRFKRLAKIFKFGISYYVLVGAVIIGFGGFIQAISLLEMNISFLRFFSSTQMLNDGLTGLVLLIPIIFIAIISYVLFWDSDKYFGFFYFLIVLLLILGVIGFGLIKFTTLQQTLFSASFLIGFTLLAIYALLSAYKKVKSLLLPIVIFLCLGIMLYSNYYFDNKIVDVNIFVEWENQLANKDDLICYLEEQTYFIEDYNINYFNDKYIFIEFNYSTGTKFRVLPIELLFSNSNCH